MEYILIVKARWADNNINKLEKLNYRKGIIWKMSPLDFDPRNDGYWGDTTATLDWCEQNYEVRKCHENVSFCSVKWKSIQKFALLIQKAQFTSLLLDGQQSHRWAGTSPSSGTLWPTCPWSYLQSGASTNPSRWLKKGRIFFTASNEITSEGTWNSVPGELFGTSACGHWFHHVPYDSTVRNRNIYLQ